MMPLLFEKRILVTANPSTIWKALTLPDQMKQWMGDVNKILAYSHLSSVSRLEDTSANYSILQFDLTPIEVQTALTLTIKNFPTETIYKHLAFYWRGTMEKIKLLAEGNVDGGSKVIRQYIH